ncbi:hypothetical protein P171DRAFT_479736 [Karstenula rhodostoma CBS 690.94]|uniref:Geranylgeranyl pyrophosphate synthetase n=1 Tax=Karstenula rhodostoma CBS 690.94 TaxID=1392251 RepID=A0A9P4PXI4_9PLEO|nr:hypothetical protein P171DRAFT_479736 [Karstenula rhodostoma CBS 690.94]
MSSRLTQGYERAGFAPRPGRGRGRGRGRAHPFVKRTAVKPDIVKHPLGQLLQTLRLSDLQPHKDHTGGVNTIRNCEYVTSYNWSNSEAPTILVPGRPPLWTPLQQPQRLPEDSGVYFRDPNSAKFPRHPTEPAIRALFETNPAFSTGEVDIFACGSTMGSLLRFVQSIDKPFRFNVEVVGSTVFLIRKENDPREIIEGVRGFGHTFPEAYTTWEQDVRGSETHQRLCRYDLGRFNCVIRFECDGYLQSGPEKTSTMETKSSDLEDLAGNFKNVTVGQGTGNGLATLSLKQGGAVVPQHSIFDMKTRSGRYKKEIDMNEMYPQLWIKQIPNFIIAYHDGAGTFPTSDIHVQDVNYNVQAWERQNQAGIGRLLVLLGKIIDLAREEGAGLLEVYCPSADCLEVRRQYGEGVHALPPELSAKWKAVDEDSSGSDHEHDSGPDHGGLQLGYDSDDEPDYTACGDDCGYCGKCTY